jgi:hypothetical protein
MLYTIGQQVTLALLPKFSGGLGMISSIILVSEIVRDTINGELNPIKRALFFVTLWEFADAMGWFMSTWAIPSSSDFIWSVNGNWTTCGFQGFLLQIAIGAPLANSAFAYLFYILAKGTWDTFDVYAFERCAYSFVSIYAVGTGFLFLSLDQYNPSNQVCWLSGYPAGCNESIFGQSDLYCERGFNSHWYGLMTFYVLLWISFIVVIYINWTMRNMLLQQSLNDEVQWITEQARMYGIAFVLAWIPSTLWFTLPLFGKSFFIFDVLAALFEPLQAFWNLLIFLKNRPQSIDRIKRIILITPYCFNSPSTKSFEESVDGNKGQIQINDDDKRQPDQVIQ